MNARPILFAGPMVRALLEGRKTQTRRVVKPQPIGNSLFLAGSRVVEGMTVWGARCPYGQPGDLLWVRETWQEFFVDELPTARRNGRPGRMGIPAQPERRAMVAYRADGEMDDHSVHGAAVWRPCIHMPRWASRVTLRIADVRVQRLRDISEADARAEGSHQEGAQTGRIDANGTPEEVGSYVLGFYGTWTQINGISSWDANPWVWALTFAVIQRNVDDVMRAAGMRP